MEDQEIQPGQDENLPEKVMESLGISESKADAESADSKDASADELPSYAKKRLGMQEKRHKKEIRELQAQIQELSSRIGSQPGSENKQAINPYTGHPIESGSQEDYIHKAVSTALAAQDEKRREAEEAKRIAETHKHYRSFEDHLDSAHEKYDDFEEVVRDPSAPFTDAIKHTAMILPNPQDVLYKLGKDRGTLEKISQLHPLEQAKEIVKLSVALMGEAANGGAKTPGSSRPPMGSIKDTPVSSNSSITEKTSISDLRKKMKNGWK